MADNSVTTTFFGNEQDAVAAIARLEKKYDDLENKIKHVHAGHSHGAGHMLHEMNEIGLAAVGMVTGFAGVEATIEKLFEATKEWSAEVNKAAMNLDKTNRSLAARGAGFGAEGQETIEEVKKKGSTAGLSHEASGNLFGELIAQGVPREELLAKFDEIAVAFKTANDAKGGALSPQAFADATSKMLDRGAEATGKAITEAGRQLFAMTARSDMQVEDVNYLGATLREAFSGRGRKRHATALAQIGLNFEDVDQHGETFEEVISRIQEGFAAHSDKVPVAKQAAWWKEMGIDSTTAERTMRGLGLVQENLGQYAEASANSTSGPNAAATRLDNDNEELLAERGNDFAVKLKAAQNMHIRQGGAGFSVTYRNYLAQVLNALPGIGGDRAIGLAYATSPLEGGHAGYNPFGSAIVEEIKKQTAAAESSAAEIKVAAEKMGRAADRNKPQPIRRAVE
jgi:hypothetical protein